MNQIQARNSYDYIEKITEMYSNKTRKLAENYNEAEDRPQKEIFDVKIAYINKCDSQKFKSLNDESKTVFDDNE